MKRFNQFQPVEEGVMDELVGFGKFLYGMSTKGRARPTGPKMSWTNTMNWRNVPADAPRPPAAPPPPVPLPPPPPRAKKVEKLSTPLSSGSKIHSPYHGTTYKFGEIPAGKKGAGNVTWLQAKLRTIEEPAPKSVKRPSGEPKPTGPKLRGREKPIARFGAWSPKVIEPSKGSPYEFKGPETSTWGQITVPVSSRGGFELNIPVAPKPRKAKQIPASEFMAEPEERKPRSPKDEGKSTGEPKVKPQKQSKEEPTLFSAPAAAPAPAPKPTASPTPAKPVNKGPGAKDEVKKNLGVVPVVKPEPRLKAKPKAKSPAELKKESVDYSYLNQTLNESMVDKIQDYADWGAAALSFIPGGNLLGTAIMAGSAGVDLIQGQKTDAAIRGGLAALGLIPGLGGAAGVAVKGARAGARAITPAARALYKAAPAGILKAGAGTVAKLARQYGRVAKTPTGSKVVSNVSRAGRVGKAIAGTGRVIGAGLRDTLLGAKGEAQEQPGSGVAQSRQAGHELYRPERLEMRRQSFVEPQLAY